MTRIFATSLLFGALLLAGFGPTAFGQPNAEQMKAMKEAKARAEAKSGKKPDESDKDDKKPGDDKKNGEDGDDKDKKEGDSNVVKRPEKPGFTVDPSELDVKPVNGKVQFNFHGQPWQGVLQWLASISGLSLDWQELPDDYLNLRTQRAYTLDEARDLINQHLLARGYTMLREGEVLRVVNLDKLDPALVSHVEPSELDSRDPHEFVQTIFELDWIPAATAEEELKPLLSPNGKLTKLTTTNRLHAMDVVVNLKSIRNLLAEEQSGRGEKRLVRSFKLEYARAADVKSALEDLLDIDDAQSGGGGGNMDRNQMRMMQQMQQQMQQMQQQKNNKAGAPKDEKKTSIIANPRENEIIATAAPETMQIIEQTVKLLDAAPDSGGGFQAQLSRIQAYRLANLDAETLSKMLEDLGGLSPTTVLTPDEENSSIIVNGPIADHYVVQEVINKLDGSDRSFEVIRLRRLPADYVAGTIRFMMGGQKEEEDNNRRRYYYFGYDRDDEDAESPQGEFRVDADVAGNRLLIYANPIEMEQIFGLLEKLGEVRPQDGDRANVRVLNLTDEQAAEFLRRLEDNWQADESHPLKIDPELKQDPEQKDQEEEFPIIPEGDPFTPASPTDTTSQPQSEHQTRLVSQSPTVKPARAHLMVQDTLPPPLLRRHNEPAETPPQRPRRSLPETAPDKKSTPVTIRRGPDGNLVVHSEDPDVLNVVEDLMYELAPPPKDFHIFKLKYPTTYTYDVVYNLEEFFGVGLAAEEDDEDFSPFFYRYSDDDSSDETPLRLSERKELKFIPDEYSRTILVQGASPEQLETIGELIEIYDQPQSQNSSDLRVTKIFSIEHAEADTIATAIKDVYRDLLSANDRALQNGGNREKGQQRPVAERSYTYVMGNNGGQRDEPEPPIKFKGLLSIGVDSESNTIVVSASKGLMGDIEELIDSLDTAAQQKEAVSVVRTGGGGIPRGISGKLKEIFGDKITIVSAEDSEEPADEKGTTADDTTTSETTTGANDVSPAPTADDRDSLQIR